MYIVLVVFLLCSSMCFIAYSSEAFLSLMFRYKVVILTRDQLIFLNSILVNV